MPDAVSDAVIGGRYRLEELVGRGGMAAVWRATDVEFDRAVAVKVLHARHTEDQEFAERFRREARVVARLSHPHLVRLLDAGEEEAGPYLVLELVEGETLKDRVRREGPLPPAEAARLCEQVAHALDYAHGQGVVHRDIKSQNVLLTEGGEAKLADFGIARLLEGEGERGLTQTDMMVGSADYIAPEQAEGHEVDQRTDIYSLGIVLWECLTGELPFGGEGFLAIAMKQVNEPLPDPRQRVPGVPAHLAAVTLRCGAKRPERRFPSAAALAGALGGDGTGGTAVVAPLDEDDDETTARVARPRRRRALAVVAVIAALVAIAFAGLLLVGPLGSDGDDAGEPLAIASVEDFDPQGDGRERPDLVAQALTPPAEAWRTERYATADFGNLKPGVGILMRLPAPALARQIVIDSPTPGARFEVLGPEGVGGLRPRLGGGTFAGAEQVVSLEADEPSDELVLWITGLVPDEDGRFAAGVGQVQLTGTANPSG